MRPGAVREEFDRTVAAAAQPVAAAAALGYGALAAVGAVAPWHRLHAFHVGAGAAAAVAFAATFAVLRRRAIPRGWGHAAVAGLGVPALAHATVTLAVEDPDETVLFVMVVVGAGAVPLSWRWFTAVLAASWACWLTVAVLRSASGPGEWAEFGAYLLAATGLAVLVHRERLKAATRLAVRSFELGEALGRLRAVIEASPLAIVGADLEGTVTSWNPAAERLLGWTAEEAVGRFLPHVGPEALPGYEDRRARILQGEHVVLDEVVRRRKDGSPLWVSLSVAPIRDAEGRVTGSVSVLADLTERKRAEAELRAALERYRVLAEEVPVGVFLADARGGNVWVNERWSGITGLSAEEGRGTGFVRIIHPEDVPRVLDAWGRATAAGVGFEDEFRLRRPDGSVRWVHVRAAPVGEGADEGRFLGVVEDVTERRRAEDLLRRSEAGLRWRLAALREQDLERRRVLAATLRAQEEELARMAEGIEDEHLQQVAALGMRLEALRRRLSDEAHVEALEGLDRTVREAADGLRELLAELRPRELETGGLAEAIRRAASAILGPGVAVAVEDGLPSEPDDEVRTAAFRIAQEALRNVRDHAGARRVEVLLAGDAQGLLLEVRDDGVGPGPTPDGPGLASMRQRAELLRGWVRVGPGDDAGTVVRCRLPRREARSPRTAVRAEAP